MILSLLSCKRLILIWGELNPDRAKQRTDSGSFHFVDMRFEVKKFFKDNHKANQEIL